MNPLLPPLTAYFSADTPDRRASALTRLIEAYRQAEAAPKPEAVALPPADLAQFRTLARRVNLDSAEALLSAIATTPPLLERIGDYLAAPVVEAPAGLPETIIRPEKPVCRAIARIGIGPDWVTVFLPVKRDDFLEIVKGDYIWEETYWRKRVDGWNKAANIAAELGHTLLAAGFWIAPPTPEVRNMIVEESFELEHRRKVQLRVKGRYEGWLVLWWSRSEDCYDATKRITASRYDKPVVVVPPEYYDEVEDFADRHNFYITPAAQGAIDRARAALNAALLVHIEPEEKSEPEPANGKPPKLTVPETAGIADELADNAL